MSLTEPQQAYVDALRSGEFEQVKETLRQGGRFCCLGVACEVYRRVTGKGRWASHLGITSSEPAFITDGETREAFLPIAVGEWLGLERHEGDPQLTERMTATMANDVHGKNFAEIADLFEAKFNEGNAQR